VGEQKLKQNGEMLMGCITEEFKKQVLKQIRNTKQSAKYKSKDKVALNRVQILNNLVNDITAVQKSLKSSSGSLYSILKSLQTFP